MSKILSVCVPTYNMEMFLPRCLGSLVIDEKMMAFLEVIVVNDGSKDNSSSIAHKYATLHPDTFVVIDKQNGNYGSCINAALTVARGKYIKILDADDCFYSKALEKYIIFLQDTECDLVLTDYQTVNPKGDIIKNYVFDFKWKEPVGICALKEVQMQMHTITWKTQNLRDMGYRQTEGISYTDVEWGYFPLVTVKSATYFKCILYKYTLGRSGQTMEKSVFYKNMWQNIEVLESMLSWYSKSAWDNENAHNVLRDKLLFSASSIYAEYLIYGNGILNLCELEQLDQKIKDNYSDIFALLEQVSAPFKIVEYRFIADWRSRTNGSKMRLLFCHLIKEILHHK